MQNFCVVRSIVCEAHLVSHSQSNDIRPGAAFEGVGGLAHQDLLGGVSVVIDPRQEQIPLTSSQYRSFSARAFETVGLFNGVQLSFLNEVSDVVNARDRSVL